MECCNSISLWWFNDLERSFDNITLHISSWLNSGLNFTKAWLWFSNDSLPRLGLIHWKQICLRSQTLTNIFHRFYFYWKRNQLRCPQKIWKDNSRVRRKQCCSNYGGRKSRPSIKIMCLCMRGYCWLEVHFTKENFLVGVSSWQVFKCFSQCL